MTIVFEMGSNFCNIQKAGYGGCMGLYRMKFHSVLCGWEGGVGKDLWLRTRHCTGT